MGTIPGALERSAISGATITVGAEAADVINVAIQLQGNQSADAAQALGVLAYLSDNSDGSTLIATAHSGGVAVGTDGLAIELTADKVFVLVSESDGDIDLDITEAGAKTAYLVLVAPNGELIVSDAITHAA